MRYFFALLIILTFVVGCGCANSPMVFPAFGFEGDTADVWPIFLITDNFPTGDNGYMVFYDQETDAWKAPRLMAANLAMSQLTPQRNSIGWRGSKDDAGNPGGVWNVSYIENVTFDLIMMESPDDAWQDDAGAWGLLDSDATVNWVAVDVETRQNYVWGYVAQGVPYAGYYYIDLAAGVPAWTLASISQPIDGSTGQYSIVLDQRLFGSFHCVWVSAGGAVEYAYCSYNGPWTVVQAASNYPQIITSSRDDKWCFYTAGNILYCEIAQDKDAPIYGLETQVLYTATALTDDYHATWMAMDDTIHVVLIDANQILMDDTHLIYIRRTPNGWETATTLITVDTTPFGDDDILTWPQICVDELGNIFVSYILGEDAAVSPYGDLQGFYLDADDYHDYETTAPPGGTGPWVGNWAQYTDIDGDVVDVKAAIMPDYCPVPADM